MSTLIQDLRYGLRMLARNPGFTAVAVIALALGIGANTCMYSTINAMLLRPFPFQHLNRAVAVWESAPKQNLWHSEVAPANFRDWEEQSRGIELLSAIRGWDVNLTGKDLAVRLECFQVSANFFSLLGTPPQLGRTIAGDNFGEGRGDVVVLSNAFWQRALGADPAMVGRSVLLSGQKFTVIGVMPPEFDFPVGAQAWAPLDLSVKEQADRANGYLRVFGRLKPGVSIAKAQDDFDTITARLAREYPQTNSGRGAHVLGLVDDLTFGSSRFVGVLTGAAGFVLLLACANVANLLLARVTGRQKEIALRLALGASRWQIARLLMVEGTLLSLLGGLAGLLLGAWNLDLTQNTLLPPFIVQHVPGLSHLQPDWRVLIFTMAVAFLAGILSSAAPALQVSRPDLNDILKEGPRGGTVNPGRRRLRSLLVVTEISLALVLLVSSGLMVIGFRNMTNENEGFDRRNVLTFRISLAALKYNNADRIRGYYEQLIPKLQSLPSVEAAGAVTAVPASWWGWDSAPYVAEGEPPSAVAEVRTTDRQSVTPGFFRALRVPLLEGRFISARDGAEGPPVVNISEGLARKIWPHQEAVGRRIRFGPPEKQGPWCTVVGVVGGVRSTPWNKEVDLTAYLPLAQAPQASTGLVVRTSGDPLALTAAVRSQVLGLDAEQPPYDLRSLEQLVSDDLSGVESSATMMTAFGILALILAAAGVFAVMAYSVLQRTHEIGVRMALGAQPTDVLTMVIGHAAKLVAIGLGIGIAGALAMAGLLTSLLFGVVRMNWLTFIGLTALLAGVAALAAYVPARWATKVDPMVALRYE